VPPYIFRPQEVREGWNLLYAKLMLDGRTIGGDKVVSTKVDDENILVVAHGNVVNTVYYEQLFVFNDKNIIGLPAPREKNANYEVIDLLIPLSLSVPHVHHLRTEEQLLRELFLIKKGLRTRTELYAISHLSEKQLDEFDYSDTIVRFACEDLLKRNGFEGARNGKHKLAIKLQTVYREIIKQMDYYEDTEKIKFIYGS